MQISALSIGSRVPHAPFAGTVQSVFSRTCNIELCDGRLLTLLDASHGTVPHGLRLATRDGFDFRDLVSPHEPVIGRGKIIRCGNRPLTVDIRDATAVCTSIVQIALDMENGSTRCAWRAALSQIADIAQPEGLGALLPGRRPTNDCSVLTGLLLRQARARIPALVRAAGSFDIDGAILAAVGGIGMGPGLTPSWDDFLVGYISGLHTTTRGRSNRWRFVAMLGEAVRAASSATTVVSRAQLEHAVTGHVSERLAALLGSLAQGDVIATTRATADVLGLGSTSGADTLLGVLLGVAAWEPQTVATPSIEALPFLAELDASGSKPVAINRRRPQAGSDRNAAR